ncbi:MAG: phenylalanine--tRNA ligase subunit beta [Desulfobacteraceae bacterium]|nr:MAG: phenylalanine--tRNA ligase subunit beta [Desulfobacteraceae bacterium]
MKFSLSWLQEYLPIEMTTEELAEGLTMAGLEVDSVTDRYAYLDSVLTGKIVEIKPHPNAEKLKVCLVDTGDEKRTIVCGAPNAELGMITACALPGTVFPNGAVLEKGFIRNQESSGMLCSKSELGIGLDAAGIISLPPDTIVGQKLAGALGISDMVFEVDLTPNRPDCLGIIGIAREIAAIQGSRLQYPDIESFCPGQSIAKYTSVEIQNPDLCPRYSAGLLLDVSVGPSPFWLQDRLLSIGLRPINNLVDVTNFVMMETGQPLHAFDFDMLSEKRIVVRAAEKGEIFTTLDNKERSLLPGMLLICDAEKPIALAGVMGGMNSEISEKTINVLIESACFNPGSIRKTSKTLGLNTDASFRFERGVDPGGTVRALKRAALLMKGVAGGRIVDGVVDENPIPASESVIQLSMRTTNRLLGMHFDQETIAAHLSSIDFSVNTINEDSLEVTVPSFRVDVSRHEDLVEEIARLSGYNNIPTTFPLIPADTKPLPKRLTIKDQIKSQFVGYGFTEVINYSFAKRSAADQLRLKSDDPGRSVMEILNPLSEDQAVMRTSLIPGLLETAYRNVSHQIKNLKLFETGKVFFNTRGKSFQPQEVEQLSCLWTGKRVESSWYGNDSDCDFFDLKGAAEGLFHSLRLEKIRFTALPLEKCSYLKPGHSAEIYIEGEPVGTIGEVHHEVLSNYNLKQAVYTMELNLDLLIPRIPEIRKYKSLPKYPSVSRDITIIVDRGIEAQSVMDALEKIDEKILEKTKLFDVYAGGKLPSGKKSLSLRLTYRSTEKTLEDDFVNDIHRQISSVLIRTFNATLP